MQSTKQDMIDRLHEMLVKIHGRNIGTLLGIGSFFTGDMHEPLTSKDRTLDLIMCIYDIDTFYDRHPLPSVKGDKRLLKTLNLKTPVYLSHDEGFRVTVIPDDRFDSWTRRDSSIGYFLTGRLQKPLETIIKPDVHEKKIIERSRDYGIEDAVNLLDRTCGKLWILLTVASLSYLPESLRGWTEINIRKRHKKLVKTHYKRFNEIYTPRIDTMVNTGRLLYDKERRLYTPAKDNHKVWKKRLRGQAPGYAKVLYNLARFNPDPAGYAYEKACRNLRLASLQNTSFPRDVFSNIIYPFLWKAVVKSSHKRVRRLPLTYQNLYK